MAGVLRKASNGSVFFVAITVVLAGHASNVDARSAFVASWASTSVSVVDTSTGLVTATIPLSGKPQRIALLPNGFRAYASMKNDDAVSVIDTTEKIETLSIAVGKQPMGVAATADGSRLYVANSSSRSNSVSVIDTDTDAVIATVGVGARPREIAIAPSGDYAYISNSSSDSVSVIDTETDQVATTVSVGRGPRQLAVTPDGGKVYVANNDSNDVSVIDASTNTVISTIPAGSKPEGVAVATDGDRAYVSNSEDGSISVIDTLTDNVVVTIEGSFEKPATVAIAPNGSLGYVANEERSELTLFDTATNEEAGAVELGASSNGVSIEPNQGPSVMDSHAGEVEANEEITLSVDATDRDGTVAMYSWDFGDGEKDTTSTPTVRHRYRSTGTKTVTVTVTDDEFCSDSFVFTGQTASCTGSEEARTTFEVTVLESSNPPPGNPPPGNPPPGGGTPSTAPNVQILSGPAAQTRSIEAVFVLSSDQPNVGFECRLDSEQWGACGSLEVVYGLALGKHSFTVRAQNREGLTGPEATWSWSVDRKAPSIGRSSIKPGMRISRSRLRYISGTVADSGAGLSNVKVRLYLPNRSSKLGKGYCPSLSFKSARRIVQRCNFGFTKVDGARRWRIKVSPKMRRKLRLSDLYRLSIKAKDRLGNQRIYRTDFRINL